MAAPGSPSNEIAEAWSRLSFSSKRAFTLAQRVSQQVGESDVEMAPLLYALLHPSGGHQDKEATAAGLSSTVDVKAALGLDRLKGEPELESGEPLEQPPSMAAHVQQALAAAHRLGRANKDGITHSANMLAGALRVTESSVVTDLLASHDFSDLPGLPSSKPPELLMRVGPRTRVYAQQTNEPWKLRVDAGVVPTDGGGRGGQLARSVAAQLGEPALEALNGMLAELDAKGGFTAAKTTLMDTPQALQQAGAPAKLFATTAFESRARASADGVRQAVTAVLQIAAQARLQRLALPLIGTGGGKLELAAAAAAVIEALLDPPAPHELGAIYVTAHNRAQADALRSAARSARWHSLGADTRRVLGRAARANAPETQE